MAEITAKEIADYIIAFSHRHGDPISNLKLQKLLYYAQAWYLAIHNKPLFKERVEAWVHGPAVPPIYGQFKGWAWKSIDYDPEEKTINFPKKIIAHLNEVMEAYGGMSAFDLERLTHSEAPWRNARAGVSPDESSNAVIDHSAMRDFFRPRLNGQN